MSTLLREVINIPERLGAEDYVLRLTDSVGGAAAERTLAEYVVTPQLEEAFDAALGLVADAVTTRASRGAFLTGSFGSGKSHFMAVLHALLRREPAARGKAELQTVIARHDPALTNAKVLPLAFHLLAARSMEQALFDGYIRQIRDLHPGAPLPAVHRSDALLDNAEGLRLRMGDDTFFATLNGDTAAVDDAWGDVLGAGSWDLDRYTEARAATPDSPHRHKLVSALVEHLFPAFTQQAEYVDIDTGLAAIATHAKGLGYDAAVLFLDELVLWLAFAVQDRAFFQRESQKITKLVESAVGNRAIPLISIVARQMDLRRWLADAGASGAEQEALDRAFKHQEGRFTAIPLGDDNLPYVAHQRLLQPRDDSAEATLRDAFRGIDRRPAVWDVLLDGINTDEAHRGADEQAFRLTYPFSPALVSTLRSLASVMQRERTALKVMQRMLVDRRDDLTIDEIISVGDAFDLIVEGESGQPLDAQAAALFRSAQKLYREKLRPAVLRAKHLPDEAALATADQDIQRLVASDDRLAKTLLLSAVAPNVPALKNLTPQRLASLNHGSIVSPLPGGEASVVLATVRQWLREVPEIHLEGDDRNPTIRVQLADIDYESIVEKAKLEDNEGRRRELVKDIVSEAIGLGSTGASTLERTDSLDIVWRGTPRRVEVLFGNVRDRSWLADDSFYASPGTWRIIIDHPFDEAGHSSAEDFARVEEMKAAGRFSQTIVWLPRFLSAATMRDLRRLVILQWLLERGDRWQRYADHLSEGDRLQARAILDGQRTNLRRTVEQAIQQAYGTAHVQRGVLDDDAGHTDILVSLDTGFVPSTPQGASLGSAFRTLVDRAFSTTYPDHPTFEPADTELKARDYKAVADAIPAALDDPLRRAALAALPNQQAITRVAGPLGIASVNEQFFVFGDGYFTPWGVDLDRALGRRAQDRGLPVDGPVTVRELRGWIRDTPQGKGLPVEAVDLVVLAWAALRQRGWWISGAPLPTPPAPGRLNDLMELRQQPMPSQEAWEKATTLSSGLLGTPAAPKLVSPSALAGFEQAVAAEVGALAPGQPDLIAAIETAWARMGITTGDRLHTARTSGALVQSLRPLKGVRLIERLATAELDATPAAAGTSLKGATEVTFALRGFEWDRMNPLRTAAQGEGLAADDAAAILETLRAGLAADEMVTSAREVLREAENGAFAWLQDQAAAAPAEPPPAPVGPAAPPIQSPVAGPADSDRPRGTAGGARRRHAGEPSAAVVRELAVFLDQHPDATVTVTWEVEE